MKDKKGTTVTDAFKSILREGRKPNRLRTDKGQEFRAKVVQALFKSRNIRHFFSYNDVQSSISERVLKTVKTKLYRYFTYKQS